MLEKQLQIDMQDSDKYALVGGLFGIIDSAMDAVITINEEQRVILFNPAAEQVFGCKAAEVFGSRVDRFIPERFRKAHEGHIRKFGETGQTSRKMGQLGEIRGLRTNGEEFPIEASISQVQVGAKKLFSVILRDITERKRNEDALKESQKREQTRRIELETLMETVPLPVWVSYDRDCKTMTGNKAAYELTNLPVGTNISETAPDGKPHFSAYKDGQLVTGEDLPMQKAARTGNPTFDEELEFRFVDGRAKWVYGNAVPLRDENGNIYGALGAFVDITHRKQMEESLRESKERYYNLFSTINEGFCIIEMIFDAQGRPADYRFLEVNQAFEKQTGLHEAEGKLMRQLAPAHEAHWFEIYGKIALTGEPAHFVNEAKALNRWYDVYAYRVGRPEDRQVAILFNDITERKRAEEMLRKSEEQARWLATFPKENPDMVLRVSLDGIVLYCNPAAVRQEAWKCDIGQPLQQEPLRRLVNDAIAQNRGIEQEVELDGTYYSVAVVPASAEGYVNIYGRDITKRKHAEQALRESQARLALAADAAKMGIFDWRIHTGELYWTAQTERIFGLTAVDTAMITTHTYKDWADRIHPEDLPRIEEQISKAMDEGTAFDVEHRIIWPDKSIRWVTARALFHYDDLGQATRMLGVVTDITERKKAEEQMHQLTEELKRSNTELEEFADMVSHDLRAPLRSITGFMGLFHERYKDKFDEKAREYVNSAINGGQRMENMLTGLLEYSRVKTRAKGFASVSMQTALKDAIDNLHTTIAESRAAVTCDELSAVLGDVSQLTQLFQNLIQNAIKFRTDKRPEIHIGCKRQENAWLFSVRDNGIGIDPRFHDHIFTIFHKVHPKDERAGEGVGLAVCRRIVERHSGKIWVESEEGKGSTFYFTIPVQV